MSCSRLSRASIGAILFTVLWVSEAQARRGTFKTKEEAVTFVVIVVSFIGLQWMFGRSKSKDDERD